MNSKQQVDPSQVTREAIVQEELWVASYEAQERMLNAEIERLSNDLATLKVKTGKRRLVVAELSEKLQSQVAKNGDGDELTVHQVANRMQNDLFTKGTARTEDVVKVLGNPSKSVSVTPPTKH